MSYTPTPEEARAIAELIRAYGGGLPSRIDAIALADKFDPPKITAHQARIALLDIKNYEFVTQRDDAVAMLLKFIDQHDDEAKP